jgi:hypothetical protein
MGIERCIFGAPLLQCQVTIRCTFGDPTLQALVSAAKLMPMREIWALESGVPGKSGLPAPQCPVQAMRKGAAWFRTVRE